MLIVIAGRPGSGKSTAAGDLAGALECCVPGVDQAEQLALGHDVIIDAVNGPEAARAQCRGLAGRSQSELRFIEVQCSDEHLHRLAGRRRRIDGPGWDGILRRRREFPAWADQRLTLDTVNPRADNLRAALDYLGRSGRPGPARRDCRRRSGCEVARQCLAVGGCAHGGGPPGG